MSSTDIPTDFDAARRLYRELRTENRTLQDRLERRNRRIDELKNSLVETACAIEREEECFANALLRKMDAIAKEKAVLQKHLIEEQHRKQALEEKLSNLRLESQRLQRVLIKEEATIKNRLQKQLAAMTQQHERLRAATEAESATMAELQQCIDFAHSNIFAHVAAGSGTGVVAGVQPGRVGVAIGARGTSEPPTDTDVPDSAVDPRLCCSTLASSGAQTPTNRSVSSTPASSPMIHATPSKSSSQVLAGAPVGATQQPPAAAVAAANTAVIRSVSPPSDTSPSCPPMPGQPLSPTQLPPSVLSAVIAANAGASPQPLTVADIASAAQQLPQQVIPAVLDDDAMIRSLTRELRRMQTLRSEASERARVYERRQRELLERLAAAEAERDGHRRSADSFKDEIDRCASQAHELSAANEMMTEWATDRECLNSSYFSSGGPQNSSIAGAGGGTGVGGAPPVGIAAGSIPRSHQRTSSVCSVASSTAASELASESNSTPLFRLSTSSSVLGTGGGGTTSFAPIAVVGGRVLHGGGAVQGARVSGRTHVRTSSGGSSRANSAASSTRASISGIAPASIPPELK